jgi:hypothetical protein
MRYVCDFSDVAASEVSILLGTLAAYLTACEQWDDARIRSWSNDQALEALRLYQSPAIPAVL